MKFLFEFLPIILFFICYKFKGIFFATSIAIAVSIIQIVFMYARNRKIETMMLISFFVIVVFGGSTLLFKNEMFIKWKPTILYWLFASIILISRIGFKKNVIQAMLQKQIDVPERIWDKLNFYWVIFFSLVGGLNLYVAYNFTTNTWVNFKLFGVLGCMLIFIVAQSMVLMPYMKKD